MSLRSPEEERILQETERFLGRRMIAKGIAELCGGGLTLTPEGYKHVVAEVFVVNDVEEWSPGEGKQRGWVLSSAADSFWIGGGTWLLPIWQELIEEGVDGTAELVPFEELAEGTTPQAGDVAIVERLESWIGPRKNILLLQDKEIQNIQDENGLVDSEKFIKFLFDFIK
jgi:hypothetical protein